MRWKQPLIGFTALDSTESSAVMRFNLRAGLEAVPAMAAAAAFRPVLQNLTSCAIIRQSYVLPAVELHRVGAAPGSSAGRVGVFIFGTAAADQFALVAVPGIIDELLLSTGPAAGIQIDSTAPAVADLVNELTSGRWCNPFGYAITELIAAYRQER